LKLVENLPCLRLPQACGSHIDDCAVFFLRSCT
jgi:hypothetical protein